MIRLFACLLSVFVATATSLVAVQPSSLFQPRGKIHIPIGIPNSRDSLKTFVEAEGNFSPGFGSYGVFFALEDSVTGTVVSPTQEHVACEYGLAPGGLPIPWSQWRGGEVLVRSEVCEVKIRSPKGEVFVVGARVRLTNTGLREGTVILRAQVQSLGPAGATLGEGKGFSVFEGKSRSRITVGGNPALLVNQPSSGSLSSDLYKGDFAAALRLPVTVRPGEPVTLGFICPVLPGRRAVAHRWHNVSSWARSDLSDPISGEGGVLQPDPGVEFYHSLNVDALFAQAEQDWKALLGKVEIEVPDKRWAEAFSAITAHAVLAMNDGAPDMAAINYNVFNRGGVYVANMLQKTGNFDLARTAIDYFLDHPFNGRGEPEADNPGQVLWILGEHWQFTRDREWLKRVYPAAKKLAAMIEYLRSTPEPHWVSFDSLDFGATLAPEKRQRLKPGACDGFHPEYTEAFDIAGLRAAAVLADVMGHKDDHLAWSTLAKQLGTSYDKDFGADLRKHEYTDYSVLWPCRIYPLDSVNRRTAQFATIGPERPASWRYFSLARAHQGFFAGSRAAAHGTLDLHLDHEQMKGWYAFDEGGPSGVGNWTKVRSNWKVSPLPWERDTLAATAMPHVWSIAEFHLLLRDALAFEDNDKLILLAGVPPEWFEKPLRVRNLPTHFGSVSLEYKPDETGGTLTLLNRLTPRGGVFVRTPAGDIPIPAGRNSVHLK